MSCCTSSLIHQDCLNQQYNQYGKCPLCSKKFTLQSNNFTLQEINPEAKNWREEIGNIFIGSGFWTLHYFFCSGKFDNKSYAIPIY